ncbi:hypothetical protein BGX38DRAFT_1206767, partial [Terfezia claveryi]
MIRQHRAVFLKTPTGHSNFPEALRELCVCATYVRCQSLITTSCTKQTKTNRLPPGPRAAWRSY